MSNSKIAWHIGIMLNTKIVQSLKYRDYEIAWIKENVHQ